MSSMLLKALGKLGSLAIGMNRKGLANFSVIALPVGEALRSTVEGPGGGMGGPGASKKGKKKH